MTATEARPGAPVGAQTAEPKVTQAPPLAGELTLGEEVNLFLHGARKPQPEAKAAEPKAWWDHGRRVMDLYEGENLDYKLDATTGSIIHRPELHTIR